METVVFTGYARLLPLDRGKRSGELQLSLGAVGRVDRGMDLAGADRVAHADDRIGRVLEGVLRVRAQAARGDVDGVDAVGLEELRDLNCQFHVQAVLQEFVGAEADEDREERADLGAAEGNRLGEEAAAVLETAAVFIGALVERRGAFWPSGVDFGLYYNNFALILQQSCAPGLFPRPGRAAGGRVH